MRYLGFGLIVRDRERLGLCASEKGISFPLWQFSLVFSSNIVDTNSQLS